MRRLVQHRLNGWYLLDDRFSKPLLNHFGVLVHGEDYREGEALLSGMETT